jgi:energy-coupling factor transporter ATP-binding protein EcfA2
VGLDATGKQALLTRFADLHADGRTLVVATHDLRLLELVDRCIALRDGEVVHDGPSTPATSSPWPASALRPRAPGSTRGHGHPAAGAGPWCR